MSKKTLNIIMLAAGIILLAVSVIFLQDDASKTISGACLGIGAGIIGVSLSNLFMIQEYKKYPEKQKQAQIEAADERNEAIRNKAKAKTSDIVQWAVIAAAWVTILMDYSLWLTLMLVAIFLLKNILDFVLMAKFEKEM